MGFFGSSAAPQLPDYMSGINAALAENAAKGRQKDKFSVKDFLVNFFASPEILAMKQRQKLASQEQAADMQSWLSKELWKRANPEPKQKTETERFLDELMDPNTPPERKAILRQLIMRPVGVSVNNPDGSQEMKFFYPDAMPGMGAPQSQDDEWEYIDGGPSPSGSGGFPF